MDSLPKMIWIARPMFADLDATLVLSMVAIVVIAGVTMKTMGRIVPFAVGSIVVFAVVRLAYAIVEGASPESLPVVIWNTINIMTAGDLVVHFLVFSMAIASVHVVAVLLTRIVKINSDSQTDTHA